MKLVHLTQFVIGMNSLGDEHGYTVSIPVVEDLIEDGSLLSWLEGAFPDHLDVPRFAPDAAARTELTDGLREILGGYKGQERRKWGVAHSGLCLLVAYGTELIQRRAWDEGA